KQERVAVGRRLDDFARADDAGAAGLVVDHDRLAELPSQSLGDDARDEIGRAARGEWRDDGDLARRIAVLRGGRRGQRRSGQDSEKQSHGEPWHLRRNRLGLLCQKVAPRTYWHYWHYWHSEKRKSCHARQQSAQLATGCHMRLLRRLVAGPRAGCSRFARR